MLQALVAFWRLSRPIFLLGGIAVYALGAGIAHAQGFVVHSASYVLGQLFVTGLQLMTHYLNDYWDIEADRLNESRTMFSGGSGVLVAGLLSRKAALTAAVACLAVSGTAAALLIILDSATPLCLWLMLWIFLGAYSYSSPPLNLASSGVGELTASLVVAGLVPALALVLSEGRPSPTVALALAPLVLLHYAMLLAFEFPDERSDQEAGKRTLLVRIGRYRAGLIHNSCLVIGTLMVIFIPQPTTSAWVTLLKVVILAPLCAWQVITVTQLASGRRVRFGQVTFVAAAIFSLAASAQAAVFWTIGL
jgi:1,4-dihydroxy-2-naphthoate polyprenyltransferase